MVGARVKQARASMAISSGSTPRSWQYSIVPSMLISSLLAGSVRRTLLGRARRSHGGGKREEKRTSILCPQRLKVLRHRRMARSPAFCLARRSRIVVESVNGSLESPRSRLEEASCVRRAVREMISSMRYGQDEEESAHDAPVMSTNSLVRASLVDLLTFCGRRGTGRRASETGEHRPERSLPASAPCIAYHAVATKP